MLFQFTVDLFQIIVMWYCALSNCPFDYFVIRGVVPSQNAFFKEKQVISSVNTCQPNGIPDTITPALIISSGLLGPNVLRSGPGP